MILLNFVYYVYKNYSDHLTVFSFSVSIRDFDYIKGVENFKLSYLKKKTSKNHHLKIVLFLM